MSSPEEEKKKTSESKGSQTAEHVAKALEHISKAVTKKDKPQQKNQSQEDKPGGVKKFFDWIVGNKESSSKPEVQYEAQHDATTKQEQMSKNPYHGKEKEVEQNEAKTNNEENNFQKQQSPDTLPKDAQMPENKKAREVAFRYLNRDTPDTKETADQAIKELNEELLRPDLPLIERQEIEVLKGELDAHRQMMDPESISRAIDEIKLAKTRPNITQQDKKRLEEVEHALEEHKRRLEHKEVQNVDQPKTQEKTQGTVHNESNKQQETNEQTKQNVEPDRRMPSNVHRRPDRMPGTFGIDEWKGDVMKEIPEVKLPTINGRDFQKISDEFRKRPMSADQLEGSLSDLHEVVRYRDQLAREGKLTPEQADYFDNLYAKMSEAYFLQSELAEIPTSFSISRSELEELMQNPIAAMDKWLGDMTQALITNPDDPAAQEMIHRLRLKLSVFLSDGFEDSIASMQFGSEQEGGLVEITDEIKQKLIEVRNQIGNAKKEYLNSYTTRFKAAQFLNLYTNASDVGNERFQGLVNSIKERDWFSMDGMYGGMVGDAVNILKRKYEAKLWNDKGHRRILTPNDWMNAINETSEEMRRLHGLNQEKYEKYLSGKYFGVNNGHTMGNLEKGLDILPYLDKRNIEVELKADACRDITNLAALRMMMWLDKATIDIRGLSPTAANYMYGKIDPTEGPETFLRKYKIESIARINSFHTEVWNNMSGRPGIEKRYMRHVGKSWITMSKDLKDYAKERTKDLWERINQYNSGGLSDYEQKVLEGEIKHVYYNNPGGPPKDIKKLINNFGKPELSILGKSDSQEFFTSRKRYVKTGFEKLLEEVEIKTGIEAAESHWLRPYFNIESGWRNGMVNDYIDKYLKDYLGPVLVSKYGEKEASVRINDIFLSGKIVKYANGFFMEKLHHHEHHGGDESDYEKTLKRAALYRPHDLGMAMMEVGNHDINSYFNSQGIGKENQWKWLSEQALQASEINRQLLQNQSMVVDYSSGFEALTTDEKKFVNSVYTKEDGTIDMAKRDLHFSSMQKLTGFINSHLKEFTKQQYEPLMTKPRWSDDMPLDLIDSPDRLGAVGKGKERFSNVLTGRGWDEQSGAMRRNWRDLALAEKAKQLVLDSPEPNEEEFIKRQKQIYNLMVPYQGEKHASIAIATNLAGWLGMAKSYPGFGPYFEGLKNSSDFKTTAGEMSYSMSPDELHHIAAAVQNETQKFTEETVGDAVGYFHAVEETVDITRWNRYLRKGAGGFVLDHTIGLIPGGKAWLDKRAENLDEYSPSGNIKVKFPGALLLFGIFLLMFAAKEAGEEKKGGGGGGHH
jgi:hypothetical protein